MLGSQNLIQNPISDPHPSTPTISLDRICHFSLIETTKLKSYLSRTYIVVFRRPMTVVNIVPPVQS